MLFLIFIGYFAVRIFVETKLRKKVAKENFFLAANKVYTFSSLILGALLLFTLQGHNNFWGHTAGFMLLADSFFSCLMVIRLNKMTPTTPPQD